jgi:hypothetical protein
VSGGLPNTEGTHSVATAGIVNITATPAEGFGVAGDAPLLEWSYEFKAAGNCDLPTLPLTGGGDQVLAGQVRIRPPGLMQKPVTTDL